MPSALGQYRLGESILLVHTGPAKLAEPPRLLRKQPHITPCFPRVVGGVWQRRRSSSEDQRLVPAMALPPFRHALELSCSWSVLTRSPIAEATGRCGISADHPVDRAALRCTLVRLLESFQNKLSRARRFPVSWCSIILYCHIY